MYSFNLTIFHHVRRNVLHTSPPCVLRTGHNKGRHHVAASSHGCFDEGSETTTVLHLQVYTREVVYEIHDCVDVTWRQGDRSQQFDLVIKFKEFWIFKYKIHYCWRHFFHIFCLIKKGNISVDVSVTSSYIHFHVDFFFYVGFFSLCFCLIKNNFYLSSPAWAAIIRAVLPSLSWWFMSMKGQLWSP